VMPSAGNRDDDELLVVMVDTDFPPCTRGAPTGRDLSLM
jgi:hypothetical protein